MVRSGHVLVVDDDPVIGQLMLRSLEAQGCTVTILNTALEAITVALAENPDLILLDVLLPDIDGIELCRRLRAAPQLAEVPVIMITSLNDATARRGSLDVGADDFITKPIDFIELRARVSSILRLNRYRRLLEERTQRQRAEEGMARRNRELSLLNSFITATAAQLETDQHIEEALHHACEVLVHALNLAAAAAWLLPEDSATLLRVAVSGMMTDPARTVLTELISHEQAQRLAGAPWTLDSVPPDIAAWLGACGDFSPIAAPITINGRAAGGIALLAEGNHVYDAQERSFVQSLASALGQAIKAALLRRQLQRYADQLEEVVAIRTHELRAERDRTQAILEALGEAVLVTNGDGIINYANPAAVFLTGKQNHELIGSSWSAQQHSESANQLYLNIHSQVRAGHIWRGEVVSSRHDGTRYDAALTVAPIFDLQRSEEPAGVVSVHRDITPLKAAERMKDLFISNVSHELRTPLSIIALHSGNLDTLYERLPEDTRRHLIREVRTQTQLLNDLISDILDLSRIDSGKLVTNSQLIDLGELLAQEVAQMRPLAHVKGLRLEMQTDQRLILFGDPAQLGQCIRNLLSNAIKFTHEGGTIRCEGRRLGEEGLSSDEWPNYRFASNGSWAGLRVVDTGIGIDAKHIGQLFERFYRVQSQTRVPGTGLGLAIVRELITRHGGWPGVASTPGVGSTFALYVPLVEAG